MQVGSYRVGQVYWKASHNSFYVKVAYPNGKREERRLDSDRDKAQALYCDLVADLRRQGVPDEEYRVRDLIDRFLDHVKANNAPLTYRWYKDFLKTFSESIPPKLTVKNLKHHHVENWLSARYPATGNTNTRHDAVACVKRVFNWAVRNMGYLTVSPLANYQTPPKVPRQTYITSEQWAGVLALIKDADPFKDFLTFLLLTGCRPQEARIITARDIRENTVYLDKVPGKKGQRTIILSDEAEAILAKWAKVYSTGPVLRNTRGVPWTSDALNCRFRGIKKKTDLPVCCYLARHSAATQLLEAGASAGAVGALLGHRDATMVLKVYGKHIERRDAHLRQCLTNALTVPTLPVVAEQSPAVS
jgi:integrase